MMNAQTIKAIAENFIEVTKDIGDITKNSAKHEHMLKIVMQALVK